MIVAIMIVLAVLIAAAIYVNIGPLPRQRKSREHEKGVYGESQRSDG